MSTINLSLEGCCEEAVGAIRHQVEMRTYRASNELRNAALLVLRGSRGGRRYRVPGTRRYYSASLPGQPPAVRTGHFRSSWQAAPLVAGDTYTARIQSQARTDNGRYLLGEILEGGTSKMAPRLHHDRIREKALPQIRNIYMEPYNV